MNSLLGKIDRRIAAAGGPLKVDSARMVDRLEGHGHRVWRLRLRGVGQTLQGSFSAVSKPNFASKYAFESSRRDLHNALLCTALQSQFFVKNLPKNLQNFPNLTNF